MVSGGAGERGGSRQQKGSPRMKVGTKGRGPVGCMLSSSRAPLQGHRCGERVEFSQAWCWPRG